MLFKLWDAIQDQQFWKQSFRWPFRSGATERGKVQQVCNLHYGQCFLNYGMPFKINNFGSRASGRRSAAELRNEEK